MKKNITTDNYEAYLLDYMEGNLSTDETLQLQAFVAAQGLDWDELTEPLPYLEAPQIAYENNENLKKKGAVVPLYVKIASAAAAAGLLLTVGLWPERQYPYVEPVAELKPILPQRLITESKTPVLPQKTIQFIQPHIVTNENPVVPERIETPLLTELQPIKTIETQIDQPLADLGSPNFDLLTYRMNVGLTFSQYNKNNFGDYEDDERDLSLISKGLLWLTKGRHDSFASIISSGISTAKKEISWAAIDMALTAYHRADESFEEMKENWEEKLGE